MEIEISIKPTWKDFWIGIFWEKYMDYSEWNKEKEFFDLYIIVPPLGLPFLPIRIRKIREIT